MPSQDLDDVTETSGTGRTVSPLPKAGALKSAQHHEQDIRHVVVQQETKTNIAGRHRPGVCSPLGEVYATICAHRSTQTDTRSAAIEVKIKKLDGELARYKEQMSKLRNGPGKVRTFFSSRDAC